MTASQTIQDYLSVDTRTEVETWYHIAASKLALAAPVLADTQAAIDFKIGIFRVGLFRFYPKLCT